MPKLCYCWPHQVCTSWGSVPQQMALLSPDCAQNLQLGAQSLENNKRIQKQNNAPLDFPAFLRQGYDIKIMADGYERDDKGLIYKVAISRDA